jgi:diguanylate cyclase (GGDEF)-like protein
VSHELITAETYSAFREALKTLAPSIQADAERHRPEDLEDAAGWRLALGACAKLQAVLADGSSAAEVDDRLGELLAISPARVPVRVVFEAAGTVERVVLDELASDPDLGRSSDAWSFITQRVRRGTLDLLGRFTEALNDSPDLLYDQTTTLLARRVLDLVLPNEMARAARHQRPLALLVMSVDHVHALEDRLGPGTGERVLERIGILTRRYFRVHDWLTRFDAHAICALLPETGPETAAMLAERFRVSVRQRFVLEDHRDGARLPITLTVAVVGTDAMPEGVSAEDLLRDVSDTLVGARQGGGDRLERGAIEPREVSIGSAAAALGIDTLQIRRMIREGRLSTSRRGRHTYVSRMAVERLRESRPNS